VEPAVRLIAAGALLGAVAATLAVFTGNQLRAASEITPGFVPVIDRHAPLGPYVVVAAWPFAVLALVVAVLGLRSRGSAPRIVGRCPRGAESSSRTSDLARGGPC
jgi:hypothetical protein